MEKTIGPVMPIGAPWCGPESELFISCFASLVMALEGYGEDSEVYCTEDLGLCKRCGHCSQSVSQKKHEELHHLFLTVSGIGLSTVWRDDMGPICLEEHSRVAASDEYIARIMDFAGYRWKFNRRETGDVLKREIVESIDRGIPVLACHVFGQGWSLVTGYTEDGDTLIGRYVPLHWDRPEDLAEAQQEQGVYKRADWSATDVRAIIVTEKSQPRIDFPRLLLQFSRDLPHPNVQDCHAGTEAYDACLRHLADDGYYRSANREALIQSYFYVHQFIGTLAENRCFAAFAFLNGFYGRVTDPFSTTFLKTIGAYFMDTHNKCWKAWAAMGKNHICEPELYAEKFRDRAVRDAVAGWVLEFRRNDHVAAELLADCERIDWFKP